MTENETVSEVKKRDPIYITILIILALALGFVGWELSTSRSNLEICGHNTLVLQGELAELNSLLGMNENVLLEGENLKENLVQMLNEYDLMVTDNSDLQDSIEDQKEQIQSIIEELDKEKGKNKKNARKIYKLKKETETLRRIMKGYVHTIDSLNTKNIALKREINDKNEQITVVTSERDRFQSKAETLESKIALGAVLKADDIVAVGIRVTNSGRQRETSRASRANLIRTCFTIQENKLAEAGSKNIYMQVVAPSGNIVIEKEPIQIVAEEQEMEVSAKRQVDYQNEKMDLCIYLEGKDKFEKGTHVIRLYADGSRIGESSFAFK